MSGDRISFADAIVLAIAEEMRTDPDVFLFGQDVGPLGGVMQSCRGLYEEFGARRVRGAPISESAIVGAAIGAALVGKRPICEISFGEFLTCAMNQLVLQAPNLKYMTAGRARVPVVIRTRVGDGPYRGHPQSYEAWFAHVPGLKVVMPSTPSDAWTLMRAAIRDDGPVLFFEHMYLYHGVHGELPSVLDRGSLERAAIQRQGRDATVVATARMVHHAVAVADQLAREGIEIEIVDPRVLNPLDEATILESVRKTGRLVVAHEAWKVGGLGGEIAALVAERAFYDLQAPIVRVGAVRVPIPSVVPLRTAVLPQEADLLSAIRAVLVE